MVSAACALCASMALLLDLWMRRLKTSTRRVRFGYAHVALLVYLLLQLVPRHPEQFWSNTLRILLPNITGLCLYFILTNAGISKTTWLRTVQIISTFSIYMACVDIVSVRAVLKRLSVFDASSLSGLRSLIPVVGDSTKNDNLMFLLLLLPFSLSGVMHWRSLRPLGRAVVACSLITLTSAILLGFSRGTCISLLLPLATLMALSLRDGIRFALLCSGMLLAGCLAVVLFVGGTHLLISTLLMNDSNSELRSTQGRLIVWKTHAKEASKHPIIGLGEGSSGLVSLTTRSEVSDRPFTARSYNMLLELITSSGVIGAIAYLVFIVSSLMAKSDRKYASPPDYLQRHDVLIIKSVLVASIMRDMTTSSLIEHGPSIICSLSLCGLIQAMLRAPSENFPYARNRWYQTRNSLMELVVGLAILIISALSLYYQHIENRYVSGYKEMLRGNSETALEDFSAVLPWGSSNPLFSAAFSVVSAELALGEVDVDHLHEALPLLSENQQATLLAAAASLQHVVEASPHDPTLWVDLGWIYSYLKNDRAAETDFRRGLAEDPTDPASLISMGLLLEREGNINDAQQFYTRAVEVSPGILRSHFFSSLRGRAPSVASSIVENSEASLLRQASSPISQARLGSIYLAVNRLSDARRVLTSSLVELPGLSEAWANLATAKLISHEGGEAYQDFTRALCIEPGNVSALSGLANLIYGSGNLAGAEMLMERALALPLFSDHAVRTARIYGLPSFAPDDLLPPGLLWSLHPIAKVSPTCIPRLLSLSTVSPPQSPNAAAIYREYVESCITKNH